jgi:hypothetical protein
MGGMRCLPMAEVALMSITSLGGRPAMSRKEMIEKLIEWVLDEFLQRIDPAEKRWPALTSFAPLRDSLRATIEAAIGDWETETEDALDQSP